MVSEIFLKILFLPLYEGLAEAIEEEALRREFQLKQTKRRLEIAVQILNEKRANFAKLEDLKSRDEYMSKEDIKMAVRKLRENVFEANKINENILSVKNDKNFREEEKLKTLRDLAEEKEGCVKCGTSVPSKKLFSCTYNHKMCETCYPKYNYCTGCNIHHRIQSRAYIISVISVAFRENSPILSECNIFP